MPANRTLQPKFKPHTGRTFSLRKVKVLGGYATGKACHAETERVLHRTVDLGEAVFVLDETNTRVCVVSSTGQSIWIQKYYLHKEVVSGVHKNVDTMAEIISKILEVSKNLRENVLLSSLQQKEANLVLADDLEGTVSQLRAFTDEKLEAIQGRK